MWILGLKGLSACLREMFTKIKDRDGPSLGVHIREVSLIVVPLRESQTSLVWTPKRQSH